MPPSLRGAAVVIGNFDGVHVGHQSLMQTLRHWAADLGGLPTLVITFEPHPQKRLQRGPVPERITSVRSKARWVAESGVDGLLILRFTRQLAAMPAAEFVREILVDGLAVRAVLVGDNFRFGAGGQGECTLLHALGVQCGFEVCCLSLLEEQQQVVSSTRIRDLVKSGRLAEVAPLLGRTFEMEWRVSHGDKRGQRLGFPTANLALTDRLHPPPGVYVVESRVQDHWLPAVANLGHNPTFGNGSLHLEVHLLVPCGDLYRQVMRVRFLHRLRDEIPFADSDSLRVQIGEDVRQARAFFHSRQRGGSQP
ncbi:MAG: riboflavin biosynthesis protein RibF [Magnetococcus sp. MYC-9]